MGDDDKKAGSDKGIKVADESLAGHEFAVTGLDIMPERFDYVVHGIVAGTHLEVQDSLFALWFEKIRKGLPRRSYKVPFKIQAMPCGCTRERTNEADPNNLWHVKRKKAPNRGARYFHKECGGELG